MIMHNSIANKQTWQVIGSGLILVGSMAQTQVATAMPFQANIHYYQGTQELAITPTANYIERVRQNPRRKVAMDKVAQKIAQQLAQQGDTIVSLRLAKGLTQKELAKVTGLQQSYLSRIENQPCTISNHNIEKIAQALNSDSEAIRTAFSRHWQQMEQL